jgi:putative ABC transport system substrate-binding protein
MRRRDFLSVLGAAAAWPVTTHSQPFGKVPRIGFLGLASPSTFVSRLEAFRLGLRDFGYVEGTSITIEYRWSEGRYERLPELAADLVRSKVDLERIPIMWKRSLHVGNNWHILPD